jgi:hypothetical protein
MMRRMFQVISWLACGGTVVPSVLFFCDRLTLDQVQSWMLVLAVIWFAVTPLWMGREQKRQTT